MGDAENALPSKKRVAGRQLSKDNPEGDDDASELETGTFQRASEEVLATRKFVKVRRTQPPPASSSNPFATIRLAPPDSVAKAVCSPVQSDAVSGETVTKEKDGANEKVEKCGNGEGTESGIVVDETNGIEGPGRKLEEDTDVSTNKDADEVKSNVADVSTNNDDDEVKSDAADVSTNEHVGEVKSDLAEKKVENRGEDADSNGGRETSQEEKNDTEEGTGEAEKTVGGKTEEAIDKTVIVGEETIEGTSENGKQDEAKPVASFSSFQQLSSSQNAFTGLSGTGFGTSSFSFRTIVKEGPTFDPGSGSVFAFKSETQSFPSFGSGSMNNGNFSLQASGISAQEKAIPSMPVVPVETGEENETVVFIADAILYEYLHGGWKERGKGELKVNTQTSGAQKARLVMRARGNYRLILNANLYPDMTLTNMEKKGVTFACLNNAGDKLLKSNELTTFALKFKDSSFVEEFRSIVTEHQGMKETVVKIPENSPKASED